ncbi:hypothetical protein ABW365_16120 [Enterococcus avium]
MRYFGFELGNENDLHLFLEKLKKKGTTIVEDITHSYFMADAMKFDVDYYICSIRKWGALPSGGLAMKKKDIFRVSPYISSDKYVEDQLFYMKLKSQGMNSYNGKSLYEKNAEYNKKFNILDWKYKIDSYSLNYWQSLNRKRIVNKKNRKWLIYIRKHCSKFKIKNNWKFYRKNSSSLYTNSFRRKYSKA